jgi:hypothetical protein
MIIVFGGWILMDFGFVLARAAVVGVSLVVVFLVETKHTYTIALVRYDFYMFLRRRLKICHVFSAFYLYDVFGNVFGAFEGEGEGGVTTTITICV